MSTSPLSISSLLSSPSSSSPSLPSPSSRATTPSSGPHLLLLPPSCATPVRLQAAVKGLEQGTGEFALLCVQHEQSKECGVWLRGAVREAAEALGEEFNGEWLKTLTNTLSEEVSYFVSQSAKTASLETKGEVLAIDECLADAIFDSNEVPKLTPANALSLFSASALRSILALPSPSYTHTLYVLECPPVSFPPLTAAPFGVPARSEWVRLWAAWDLVTLGMIPPAMLHQKPIDLRHKCLFYIGHIPTFLDMLLAKALGEPATEPKNFWQIFERGIDPHVDDPDHCHSHSEVPEADEDWPVLDAVLAFRDGVRARLLRVYDELDTGARPLSRHLARTLVMTLEHEGFHVETLLYMLIQRAGSGTLPPPGFTSPPWRALASQWAAVPAPATPTTVLGPATVVLGQDDSEADDFHPERAHDVAGHVFGWDNESPPRAVSVGKFQIDWRPVTNGEFYEYWRGGGDVALPKSWVQEDGEVKVRTLYGPVPMEIACHWPVLTSYDDMTVYARSKGGRLPTEPELRLFFDTYEVGHHGGANVGFRNWHPVPATAGCEEHGGRGSNGGVWEWTSDEFKGHDGLVPTDLFVGYSTDFFDGKHQVVLGASYATIPRLAGRRTVRNFYQHNYPYPWVGGRVVYDAV